MEIKRLSFHLESVTADLRKKEQQMRARWLTTKAFLDRMGSSSLQDYVNELEEKNRELASSNQKLKDAIKKNNCLSVQNMPNFRASDHLEAAIRERDQRIEILENEKQALLNELESYEDYIEKQVGDMRKISYYIERLSEENQSGKDCQCSCKSKLEREQANRKMLQEQINSERKLREQAEDSLSKIMALYEDLSQKNKNLESRCKKIDNYTMKPQRVQELEEEIRSCKCLMKNQDIKIGDLETNLENQTGGYEEKLADLEKQLKSAHQHFSFEKMHMTSHIKGLEEQIGDFASRMAQSDENGKVLLQQLDQEKQARANLEVTLQSMTKSKENLSEMLRQARFGIKSMTQKLEESGTDSHRENLMKISALESELVAAKATIKKLRENLDKMKGVMDQNLTVRTLSAQLHESSNSQVNQLQETNEDLTKRSQDLAQMCCHLKNVVCEKDKTFAELKNQLIVLREQLENEQKLREDTESAIAQMAAAGDLQFGELNDLILVLTDEKDALKAEIQKLMKGTGMGKLKARAKKLEQENDYLRKELKKFVDYLQIIMPGYIDPEELAQLKKQLKELTVEVNKQKTEVENEKTFRMETVEQLKRKLEDYNRRIHALMDKNDELRNRKNSNSKPQTLILLEKKRTGDGEADYRYLCGLGGENKQVSERMGGTGNTDDPENVAKLKRQLVDAEREISQLKEKLRHCSTADPGISKEALSSLDEENKRLKSELKRQSSMTVPGVTKEALDLLKEENKRLKNEIKKSSEITPEANLLGEENKKLKDEIRRLKEELREKIEIGNRNLETPMREKIEIGTRSLETPMKEKIEIGTRSLETPVVKEVLVSKSVDFDDKRRNEATMKALEDENANLKESLKKFQQEKQDLRDPLVRSGSENLDERRRRDTVITTLQDENTILREELKKVQRELTSIRHSTRRSSIDRLNKTTSMVDDRDEETTRLKEEIKKLQREVTTLRKSARRSSFDTQSRSTSVDYDPNELKKLQEQFANKASGSKEKDELVAEIDGLKGQIVDLMNKGRASKEEIQSLGQDNEKLKSLLKMQSKKTPSIHFVDLQESKMEEALKPLKTALTGEQNRVIELEELWRQCENRGESLKIKNEELEAEIGELKERTKLPSASKLLESQFENIHDNLTKWQASIGGVVADMTNKVDEISKKESAQNREDLKLLTNLLEELKNILDNTIKHKKVVVSSDFQLKHVSELERQLLEKVEENDRLKSQVENLERIIREIQKNTGVTSPDGSIRGDKVEVLQERLRAAERANSNFEEEIKRLRDQRMSLFDLGPIREDQAKKIAELEETIKGLRVEIEVLRRPPMPKGRELPKVPSEKRLESDLEQLLAEWQKNYYNDIGKLREEMEEFMLMPERCEAHGDRINELERELEKANRRVDKLEKDNALLVIENEHNQRVTAERYNDAHPDKQMQEIVDHLKSLEKKNDALKTRTVQLELDNGKLRNELEKLVGKDTRGLEKEMQRMREFEKHALKCQEKFKFMKKRLMKVEIENRNLTKEYIDTLIEKEKLVLQGHEQDRRLREISKLLKKTQEKKQSLTNRIVKLQVENENLKQQIDSILSSEMEERLEKLANTDEKVRAKSMVLEHENEQLRDLLLHVQANSSDSALSTGALAILSKPKDEDLRLHLLQLELENENLKRQLEEMKAREILSQEGLGEEFGEEIRKLEQAATSEEEGAGLKVVELQIENDYLKNELKKKEKAVEESNMAEKRVGELEEEVQKLTEAKENVKKVMVELELDNEYLRKELERISHIQESLQSDTNEKNLEKQNHTLKKKIENQEAEVQKLLKQIEEMGENAVSLEAHTQQKLLREIHRLFREYEQVKPPISATTSLISDKSEIQERMRTFKEQYEPQLQNLKKDLDRLTGKDKFLTAQLESQLRECREKSLKLDAENKNLKIALEILLKEKGIMSNVKLVKEVEQQLKKYEETSSLRTVTPPDEIKIEELETRLKECQKVNQMLRKEKLSLASHIQDKKIKDLEAQLQQQEEQIINMDQHQLRKASEHQMSAVKIQNQQEELAALKETNNSLKKEVESLTAEKNLLQTKLQIQAKECQGEKDEMKKELDRLYKVNEVQQKQKTDLEKQLGLRRTDSTSSIIRSRRVSFVDLPSQASTDVELIMHEFRKLRDKYEENKKKLIDLEEQLKKCRDMNKELKKRLKKLGEKVDSKEDLSKSEKSKPDVNKDDSKPDDDKDKEQQLKKENADLQEALDKLAEEQQDNQIANEVLREEYEKLREENLLLQKDVRRVKQLEERLREANTKCRSVKFELQKEKLSLQNRRSERSASELEEQLMESRTENEIFKVKLENLRKEVARKEVIEEENKNLKDQLNSLMRKLVSSDEENKNLKDEVNRLMKRRDELLLQNKDQEREMSELENKIRILRERLEEKKQENERLTITVSDLRERLLQAEGAGGDDKEDFRKLEETLLKYQDNNEYLKQELTNLENQKSNLLAEFSSHLEEAEKQTPPELGRLRAVVQRYRDNNKNVPTAVVGDSRVHELEEQIQKCHSENEKLVEVTLQLEKEIESLKGDLAVLVEEGKERRVGTVKVATAGNRLSQETKESKKSVTLERELGQQKRKWKNIVSKMTEQYEENLGRLKKRLQTIVPSVARQAENPWMVHPPPYTAMHLMWQPMITCSNPLAPQILQPQVDPQGNESFNDLAIMVDQIQKTVDDNKKLINVDTEEEEEELLDLETFDSVSDATSQVGNIETNIAELNKEFWKQQETKAKIEKLQTDVQQTMKDIKDVSQRCPIKKRSSPISKQETAGPSTCPDPDHSKSDLHQTSVQQTTKDWNEVFKRHPLKRRSCPANNIEIAGPSKATDSNRSKTEFKTVVSKCSNSMSHSKVGSNSEKPGKNNSSSTSSSTQFRDSKYRSKVDSFRK